MTNRIPSQNPTGVTQSPPFGLVAWLEQTKVSLPLKGVECRFRVCGDLVNVEVDQIFHQNSAQPMDCVYSFPLPAGAAVYRCEMHVNGRCIRARVEEQERARELAREQRAAGRRTALVEVERDNLFTLSLGNVQPGDLIVIRFAYFQTLSRLADWTSLRIPFCPGVRYIPGQPLLRNLRGRGTQDDTDQVPDASRISPPRLDALHPEAAYLVIEGELESAGAGMKDLSSPSHPVLVREGGQRFSIGLADRAAVPDCDFVLRWSEDLREDVHTAGWVLQEGAEAFALVRLQAPHVTTPGEGDGQDFYFLVDRSGSMQGLKWQKALQAFRGFLGQLGARDRAWLTLFNNTHADFAERPLTTAEWAADGAPGRLERLGADGGTEMLPALRHVLEAQARHSVGRRVALVLITDGEVGNEAAILEALRPHAGLCVHTFGIDTTVNDALLTRVAAQQRGSCCLLTPTDDIVGAVTRLGSRLRRPVLTAISVGDGWEIPADAPADLHSDEVTLLALKGQAGAKEVTVRARSLDGGERAFTVPLAARPEPALRLLWARRHIDHCVQDGRKEKAIALAIRHNLLCEGASFVAWDEAERVTVALREVYQPSLEPRCRMVGAVYSEEFSGICDLGYVERAASVRERTLEDSEDQASEYLAKLPDAASASPPPGLVRRILRQVQAPQRRAEQQLKDLLSRLDPVSREALLQQGLERPARWYARMSETTALEKVPPDRVLQMLLLWASHVPSEFEHRMAKLEALLHTLEEAPSVNKGHAAMLAWADGELAATPAVLSAFKTLWGEYMIQVRQASKA